MSTYRQHVAPFWNPVASQTPERLRAASIPELKNEGTLDDETDAAPIATTGVPSNRDDVYQLNQNPSSAYTTYNNLQFNHKSNSTINHHLASGTNIASSNPFTFYPTTAYFPN